MGIPWEPTVSFIFRGYFTHILGVQNLHSCWGPRVVLYNFVSPLLQTIDQFCYCKNPSRSGCKVFNLSLFTDICQLPFGIWEDLAKGSCGVLVRVNRSSASSALSLKAQGDSNEFYIPKDHWTLKGLAILRTKTHPCELQVQTLPLEGPRSLGIYLEPNDRFFFGGLTV